MSTNLKSIFLKQHSAVQTTDTVALSTSVWTTEVKMITVQNVVTAELAARRLANSHTKDRAAVSGGGRKPWKQKGTGRARHGSRRSPLWVGGGVTFGPLKIRNFTKKVNRKVFNKTLMGLLTTRLRENRLFITENCTFSAPKTKVLLELLRNWKLDFKTEKILWIDAQFDQNLLLSGQNIAQLTMLEVHQLSVYELLKCTQVLITKTALPMLEKRLLNDRN